MELATCINYINNALNYPSISYKDIDLYLDMAMAELNTTLHIALPKVSEQIRIFRRISSNKLTTVRISKDPKIYTDIPVIDIDDYPNFPNVDLIEDIKYAIFTGDSNFYTFSPKQHKYVKSPTPLKGIYIENGVAQEYISTLIGDYTAESPAYWHIYEGVNEEELDLSDYLPDDWILLWVIPYVCFKYTVRDGGTAQTFADELQQGFQQLQESYNIPEDVILATVADKTAYTEIVQSNLSNLNIRIPTRAIYDSMKHSRATEIVPDTIFNRGGFGV